MWFKFIIALFSGNEEIQKKKATVQKHEGNQHDLEGETYSGDYVAPSLSGSCNSLTAFEIKKKLSVNRAAVAVRNQAAVKILFTYNLDEKHHKAQNMTPEMWARMPQATSEH